LNERDNVDVPVDSRALREGLIELWDYETGERGGNDGEDGLVGDEGEEDVVNVEGEGVKVEFPRDGDGEVVQPWRAWANEGLHTEHIERGYRAERAWGASKMWEGRGF
jgi:hypothetical protein